MNYTTILTSKGTTTIPIEIRRKLGVKPGMLVAFAEDELTGTFTIGRAQSIEDVRKLNKTALAHSGTANKSYQSGDGFASYVQQKYEPPAC